MPAHIINEVKKIQMSSFHLRLRSNSYARIVVNFMLAKGKDQYSSKLLFDNVAVFHLWETS